MSDDVHLSWPLGLGKHADELWQAIHSIEERIENMANQAEVDEITAAVNQVKTDLATASANIQNEIDTLAAAQPGIDLTALKSAVAPLDESAVALGNLKALQATPAAPAAPAADAQPHTDQPTPAATGAVDATGTGAVAETPADEVAESDAPGQVDADDAPANPGQPAQ